MFQHELLIQLRAFGEYQVKQHGVQRVHWASWVCCHCTNISQTYRTTFVTLQACPSLVPRLMSVQCLWLRWETSLSKWASLASIQTGVQLHSSLYERKLAQSGIIQSASVNFNLSIWKYKLSYTRAKCWIILSVLLHELLSCAIIKNG